MMIRRSRAIGPVVVGYPALLSRLTTVTMGSSYPPEVSAASAGGTPVVPLYEAPEAVGAPVDNAAESGVGVFEAPVFEAPQPPIEEVAVAATIETLPVEEAPAKDPEPVVEGPAPAAEPEPPSAVEPPADEPAAAPAEFVKPAKRGPKAKAAAEAP